MMKIGELIHKLESELRDVLAYDIYRVLKRLRSLKVLDWDDEGYVQVQKELTPQTIESTCDNLSHPPLRWIYSVLYSCVYHGPFGTLEEARKHSLSTMALDVAAEVEFIEFYVEPRMSFDPGLLHIVHRCTLTYEEIASKQTQTNLNM